MNQNFHEWLVFKERHDTGLAVIDEWLRGAGYGLRPGQINCWVGWRIGVDPGKGSSFSESSRHYFQS